MLNLLQGYRHFVLLDIVQITGYRYWCVSGCQADHRTDRWIQWTDLTVNYMDKTAVGSNYFQFCNIV